MDHAKLELTARWSFGGFYACTWLASPCRRLFFVLGGLLRAPITVSSDRGPLCDPPTAVGGDATGGRPGAELGNSEATGRLCVCIGTLDDAQEARTGEWITGPDGKSGGMAGRCPPNGR
ncbi:MAG: hypothetical protein [Circular genetic element sp.]|nr:MAG: hypothetical protein [Circular genetic element sp.]